MSGRSTRRAAGSAHRDERTTDDANDRRPDTDNGPRGLDSERGRRISRPAAKTPAEPVAGRRTPMASRPRPAQPWPSISGIVGVDDKPVRPRDSDWWRPRPEKAAPRELRGKVAVVTGAASSLGLGLCHALLDQGMTVVLGDADGRAIAQSAAAFADAGANVAYHETNVCLLEDVEALRDAALARFGAVHLLCNTAGYGVLQGFLDHSSTLWSNVFDLNVRGVVNGLRAFLPVMQEQDEGHLSSTASQGGLSGEAYLAAYAGSQFAIVGIMESLALELAGEESAVTTSILCPAADDIKLEPGPPALTAAREAVRQMMDGRFWLLTNREETEQLLRNRLDALLLDGGLAQTNLAERFG